MSQIADRRAQGLLSAEIVGYWSDPGNPLGLALGSAPRILPWLAYRFWHLKEAGGNQPEI
jgi:hypothetical protein